MADRPGEGAFKDGGIREKPPPLLSAPKRLRRRCLVPVCAVAHTIRGEGATGRGRPGVWYGQSQILPVGNLSTESLFFLVPVSEVEFPTE